MNDYWRQLEKSPSILPQHRLTAPAEHTHSAGSILGSTADHKETTVEVENARANLTKVREILARLRKWREWELERGHSLRKFLLSKIFPRRPPCPSLPELKQLATFIFPPRASLKATVCDYGEGRFHRFELPISIIGPGGYTSSSVRLQGTDGCNEKRVYDEARMGNCSLDVSESCLHHIRY